MSERNDKPEVEFEINRPGEDIQAESDAMVASDTLPLGETTEEAETADPSVVASVAALHNAGEKKKTPRRLTERERDERKARRAFRQLTSEDDRQHFNKSVRALLGGDLLAGGWFRRHFFYIVFLVFLTIVYVSNRYSCQQEMIESDRLADTLLDRRYKALTRSSQLKEMTRRSNIEECLQDTTLRTANTPSFNLKVEE